MILNMSACALCSYGRSLGAQRSHTKVLLSQKSALVLPQFSRQLINRGTREIFSSSPRLLPTTRNTGFEIKICLGIAL